MPSVPVTGTGSVLTRASTGVTSAGTFAAGALPEELTDDELAVVDELEPVGDAETEADPEFDGDAVVADAADELSLVAD